MTHIARISDILEDNPVVQEKSVNVLEALKGRGDVSDPASEPRLVRFAPYRHDFTLLKIVHLQCWPKMLFYGLRKLG